MSEFAWSFGGCFMLYALPEHRPLVYHSPYVWSRGLREQVGGFTVSFFLLTHNFTWNTCLFKILFSSVHEYYKISFTECLLILNTSHADLCSTVEQWCPTVHSALCQVFEHSWNWQLMRSNTAGNKWDILHDDSALHCVWVWIWTVQPNGGSWIGKWHKVK